MLEAEFGQRRLLPYAFRFAPEFDEDLVRYYTVIPVQLLKAFAGSPIEYSIARWLYSTPPSTRTIPTVSSSSDPCRR